MGRTYEETGLVRAHAKWVRTSARKARVVLEHVRGLPVADARVQLRFATRHAADDILRVLESAIANAVNNHGLEEESLVVAEAFADEGVTMKRWQPRARGRAMRIRKRTAHITILLRSTEAPAPPAKAPAAGTSKAAAKAPAAKAPVVEAPAAEAPAAAAPAAKPKRTRAKKAAAPAAAEAAVLEAPEAEVAEVETPERRPSRGPRGRGSEAEGQAEAARQEARRRRRGEAAEDHPEGEEA